MKKILTIIAVLFTLNCSASVSRINKVTYDTTFVKCCNKHKKQYLSGKVVLSQDQWKLKMKRCRKWNVYRSFLIFFGIYVGMMFWVDSGLWY